MPGTKNGETAPAVVITGASSGIGEACALRLDAAGFRVFAGVRKEVDGEALQRKASSRLTPILLDITESAAIEQAAAQVAASLGETGLAGLVNNAGIAVAGPLEFLPIPELRHQLEVNVVGHMAVTQALLPLIRRQRGRIVMIGSVSGRVVSPFLGPYCASKFALEALTASLRMELAPWKIPVIMIEPGAVATPIWERSIFRADRLVQQAPAAVEELYGAQFLIVRAAATRAGRRAISVDEVSEAVLQALVRRRPKQRYRVGRDARGATMVHLIPERLREALIGRVLMNKRATGVRGEADL